MRRKRSPPSPVDDQYPDFSATVIGVLDLNPFITRSLALRFVNTVPRPLAAGPISASAVVGAVYGHAQVPLVLGCAVRFGGAKGVGGCVFLVGWTG